jgi:hypothetical protein
MKNFGEQFIHQQNPELHTSQPVEHEKVRRQRKGEGVSHKPIEKIADWLKVLERTHTGHREDPRVLDRLKKYYHKQYVIKREDIPENYWYLQRKIIVSEGRGGDFKKDSEGKIIIPEEIKEQSEDTLISDQKKSLDKWLDYFTSADADVYPTWAKYWAFTSMIKMGKLEKQEDKDGNEFARFAKRTKDTVASFPPLNPRALALTIGAIEAQTQDKQKAKKERVTIENLSVKLEGQEFKELLSTENFSKIYSQFLVELPEYSTEGLKNIDGKWVKYDQGSVPDKLIESLDGHPLEWCTANPDTARTQLEGGDFYVYYSYGKDDKPNSPTIPRIAIRMEGENKIAEVRGIAKDQNFDPYIAPILDEKLRSFGQEGERYQKASQDMKHLTMIGEKMEKNQELTGEDLRFLYEIDGNIDGFGYQKDPRIKELQDKRDKNADMLVIFDCEPEQIIHNKTELKQALKNKTEIKAYLGELFPNIFNLLPNNLEHIYTEFPEVKIKQKNTKLGIGLKNEEDFVRALEDQGNKVSGYSKEVMSKSEFSVSEKEVNENLVILSVRALGFTNGATIKQIFDRAKKLGVKLCPAETGPQLRLQYPEQPMGEYCIIGMEPIVGSTGGPELFIVYRNSDGPWLNNCHGRPDSDYFVSSHFAFVSASSSYFSKFLDLFNSLNFKPLKIYENIKQKITGNYR